MADQFNRTRRLLGSQATDRLAASHVIVFGVGGVGGYVVEALARSGVGAIDIVDNDTVSITNINRQIIALHSTVGRYKIDVMEDRIHDINPACRVTKHAAFYLPDTKDLFDLSRYDYVVDAIDTVSGKIQLVMQAHEAGVPIICSMGAGNKINPAMFEVADIYETQVDRLAKVMRKELRKRGITRLKVVYSKEKPMTPVSDAADGSEENRPSPASIAFAPSVAGLILASEVVKDLTGIRNDDRVI